MLAKQKSKFGILVLACKFIAIGLAVISITGAGVGIGIVFCGYLIAISRRPSRKEEFMPYAILGFALTESIALFGLMMAFLIAFAF